MFMVLGLGAGKGTYGSFATSVWSFTLGPRSACSRCQQEPNVTLRPHAGQQYLGTLGGTPSRDP